MTIKMMLFPWLARSHGLIPCYLSDFISNCLLSFTLSIQPRGSPASSLNIPSVCLLGIFPYVEHPSHPALPSLSTLLYFLLIIYRHLTHSFLVYCQASSRLFSSLSYHHCLAQLLGIHLCE